MNIFFLKVKNDKRTQIMDEQNYRDAINLLSFLSNKASYAHWPGRHADLKKSDREAISDSVVDLLELQIRGTTMDSNSFSTRSVQN